MPNPASTRLALVGPIGADAVANGDDIIRAIITQLEAVGAGYIVDLAANRPTAAAANKGYVFIASDTGAISFSIGSVWIDVQLHNSNLDAIGALTTTSIGRSLLAGADAAALRAILALGTAATSASSAFDAAGAAAAAQAASQPLDSDLTLYAAAASPGAQLGLSDGTTVRRGKSIIATSESRTNTAYGLMTTPDRVQNVVIPAGGLLEIAYQATWQESVDQAARAAIFIGSNQLQIQSGLGAVAQAAKLGYGHVNTDSPLVCTAAGLAGVFAGAATSDPATGMIVGVAPADPGGAGNATPVKMDLGGNQTALAAIVGGKLIVFGDKSSPMTVDISVQFKSSSGSVTVKNRALWVESHGF